MIISHLVARSANNIIGSNNDLPWSLKDDLLHFKSYTLHKPILMGRKTFESIGRPLPNRTSIVITSKALEPMDGVLTSDSIEGGFQLAKDIFPEEVIVIGGGEIFHILISILAIGIKNLLGNMLKMMPMSLILKFTLTSEKIRNFVLCTLF